MVKNVKLVNMEMKKSTFAISVMLPVLLVLKVQLINVQDVMKDIFWMELLVNQVVLMENI